LGQLGEGARPARRGERTASPPPQMAIPTLGETLREVATNPYLTAILQLAQARMRSGWCDVDCIDDEVAGDVPEYEEHNQPQAELMAQISKLTHTEKLAVVPHLRRLGYSVAVYPEWFHEMHLARRFCSFAVIAPGYACTPKPIPIAPRVEGATSTYELRTYYYATSPGMLRLRGFLWCTPRLMAWKWRAVVKANAPDAPGGQRWMAEYGSMMGL